MGCRDLRAYKPPRPSAPTPLARLPEGTCSHGPSNKAALDGGQRLKSCCISFSHVIQWACALESCQTDAVYLLSKAQCIISFIRSLYCTVMLNLHGAPTFSQIKHWKTHQLENWLANCFQVFQRVSQPLSRALALVSRSSMCGRDLSGHTAGDMFSAQSCSGLNKINLQLWRGDYPSQTGQYPGAGEDFSGFWPPKKERWLFRLKCGKGNRLW